VDKKDLKNIDGNAMYDPNNEYYNPEKNFNTGEQWAVVMTASGPKKVRMGNIVDRDVLDEKIQELEEKEKDNSITDTEKITLNVLKKRDENKTDNMLDDNRKTKVTLLPDDVSGVEEEKVISEENIIQSPKEIKRIEEQE